MKSLELFALIPILATLFLTSCASESNVYSVSSLHNYRGIDYYENGRLDNSIQEFKKAVEVGPNSAKMHFNLGIAYYENGELDKAAIEFEKALKVNPGYAEARSALGNVYMDNGKLDEALLQFKGAIEINENYADAHNNLGNAYWIMGWRDQAISKYKDAIERNPNLDVTYVNLGRAYKEEGMLGEALKELTKAKELNRYEPKVHHYLADVYYARGMLEKAVSEYKEGISLYGPDAPPENIAMANKQMALAYYKAGEYGEAVSRFKKVLEIDPRIALETGPEMTAFHKTPSVEMLEEMVSRERILAESYSLMGEKDKALKHWRNLIVHYLDMVGMPGAQIEEGVVEGACSSFNELFQGDALGRNTQMIYL
ncbi:MAG: tetratricopeptide repeat protein, partial [Candidatus Brocadiales bacterium]